MMTFVRNAAATIVAAATILIVCFQPVVGWNIELVVSTQAADAYGGEPFSTQPIITVHNRQGILQSSFEGRVSVQSVLNDDYVKFEPVWKTGEEIPIKDDDNTLISENVVNGQAVFSGLGIDAAGEGYRLKFVLYDEYDIIMGSVIGEEFSVQVGQPYKLGMIVPPEMAYGGSPFGNQPVLAIQDRGGNVVSTINEGHVSVQLHSGPDGILLRCKNEDGFTVPIHDGLAVFSDLFVNEKGFHYSLRFHTDLPLDASTEVISNDFSIGIGPPANLAIIHDVSDGTVSGGKAFVSQPRVEVRDAGGNVLEMDSTSAVRISFHSNPSGGVLSPVERSTVILQKGVAQFRNLSIDKAGFGYRMKYSFLEREGTTFVDKSQLLVYGSYFSVEIGRPQRLEILQHSSGGWAGNQPFPIQPIVALVDAGGNVVTGDSSTIITAHMTPSLSLTSRVIIDTSNDPVPFVVSVEFDESITSDMRNSYGPGDIIGMKVIFSQEVTFTFPNKQSLRPRILLNVIDSGNSDPVFAELATDLKMGNFVDVLHFEYFVEVGHNSLELDYLSSDSLIRNDYSIEDAFGRPAKLSLPTEGLELSLAASKSLTISDSNPVVLGITTTLPNGEYGAGHEVDFIVSFDREVTATGTPELPLDIHSTIIIVDTSTDGTVVAGSYFKISYKSAESDRIPWNASAMEVKAAFESLLTFGGHVCVSRSMSPNALSAGGFRWAMRFESISDDITEIHANSGGLKFVGGIRGTLLTEIIERNKALDDWVSIDGDDDMCTTKTAKFVGGSGTKDLTFRYQFLQGDSAKRLDVNQSIGAKIRYPTSRDGVSLLKNSERASSVTLVDPSIENKGFEDTRIIRIDSNPPVVVGIQPQHSTTPNGTYTAGDTLFFEVIFDKDVEVDIGVELSLNSGNYGIARYHTGSGTDTLVLKYIVNEGDASSLLDFTALDAHNTEGGRLPVIGSVKRKSSEPITKANLDITHVASFARSNTISVTNERPRVIDVSFDDSIKGRTLTKSDDVIILVTFSAPVVVLDELPPNLAVIIGDKQRRAAYVSGSGSNTLQFIYRISLGDSASPLEFKYRYICRWDGECNIDHTKGLVKRFSASPTLDADLSQGFSDKGNNIADSVSEGVVIDTSGAPLTRVASVTSSKADGTYAAGEEVYISVKFSDAVFLSTEKPTLLTNTGGEAHYHSGHGTDELLFRYISSVSDAIDRFDWMIDSDADSAIHCGNACSIENINDEKVDVRFIDNSGNMIIEPLSAMIKLEPAIPRIISVRSEKGKSPYCHRVDDTTEELCSYTIGEEIYIKLTFDNPVVVAGMEVFMELDVGVNADSRRAIFDPIASSDLELVFRYTVQKGHSTNGETLNYICTEQSCSLTVGASTTIKASATNPIIEADITLPQPTSRGISDDDLNPIIIDTSGNPRVISVSSLSSHGVYTPGDTIDIVVMFNRVVDVSGTVFMTLDVGANQIGLAHYTSGSGSNELKFEYVVGINHTSLDLDYLDSQSLHLGFDGENQGSIRQASSNPTLDALLDLPFPGSEGSLSNNADLQVVSRIPFIDEISATPGLYRTGDDVEFVIQFSNPITISGSPSMVLQMDKFDRVANFKYQRDSNTIVLSYVVKLGDTSKRLDYWSDKELYPSSSELELNGGWIKCASSDPRLHADVHLNPVHGYLDGDKSYVVNEGVAKFRHLKIGQRGKDFKVWYLSSIDGVGDIQVAEVVGIDISIEYELHGHLTDRDPGDLHGAAVSIHKNLLAVGAPKKKNPSTEVQVLTVFSKASVDENEIQVITTGVDIDEGVISSQEFSTCADAGETISGQFQLEYITKNCYVFGSPIILDASVTAEQLRTILETELNMMGFIQTTRSENTQCESKNSWTWRVTFSDYSSLVRNLKTNGDNLHPDGATISQAISTRELNLLRGSFTIINPVAGRLSREISYDAPASVVKDAIETDLSIGVKRVKVENLHSSSHPGFGRRWTILFSSYTGDWGPDVNVPNLQVDGSQLFGKDAFVWSHVGFEGRGSLGGTFAISFRGCESSKFVSYDASKDDIVDALVSLESINKVTVSERRVLTEVAGNNGFSWSITFESVNRKSDYGWIIDPAGSSTGGNLEPLEITSHLTGWESGYFIESENGKGEGDIQAQWMTKQMGNDGSDSGAVYVYNNIEEIWQKEETIIASDFKPHDLFGASVSINANYLLVGAPSKQVNGVPEQQILTCVGEATDGFFQILFRGFRSSPIAFDATLPEIKLAVLGTYGDTDNIHTTPRLAFATDPDGWDGTSSGFCDGVNDKSFSITFLTPDGGGISTFDERSGDIEAVSIDSTALIGATVHVTELRAGTSAPMGKDLKNSSPTGKQSGTAYLYQRVESCPHCTPTWTQIMKFTPMDGLDIPMDAADFGRSVIFVTNDDHERRIAVVGSPGFNQESGKVYIFHFVQGLWVLLDALTDKDWSDDAMVGNRFGASLDANLDTIIVGSPGYFDGRGAVYCFRKSENGKPYLSSQQILGPAELATGDNFGHTVSLSNNRAVICAPGKTGPAIHIGNEANTKTQAGACYVYSRKGNAYSFQLEQQLTPSNILPGDRFGCDVSMSPGTIAVGQIERFTGKFGPPRPVQVIKTLCKAYPCRNTAGSLFRLSWKENTSWTPFLRSDISANRLRDAIENNLHSGPITVSRTILSDKDGGYSWHITFDSYTPFFREENHLHPLMCDVSATSSLFCEVSLENDVPQNIRSKVHLFDFDEDSGGWNEQSFLFPSIPQRQDMFGFSVAMDNDKVVVGAPNRDLLNINSGSAHVFDIRFLDLSFSEDSYLVEEGETIEVEIKRSKFNGHQLVAARTMDRNAEHFFQSYINELFTLKSDRYDKTSVDVLTYNSAYGRAQYYGSNERRSRWIKGEFDIQGINDYEFIDYKSEFKPGIQHKSTWFAVNDDSISEKPYENTTIQINLKGMFASQLGRLKVDVHINDKKGQGYDDDYFHVLEGDFSQDSSRMGSALDIDRLAEIIVVAYDEASGIDAYGTILKNLGIVKIFKKVSGNWNFIESLTPPMELARPLTKFGSGVSVNTPYGRDDTTILVGAPGCATAFVFVYNPTSESWKEQARLHPSDSTLSSEHRFGGSGAVALHGDLAFVGSSTMEQVYIYRRTFVADKGYVKWELYSVLRSNDYDYDVYGRGFSIEHMHRQDFGITLKANKRLLLVAAPFADYGNRGNVDLRERFYSNGVHNEGLGKGKVYAFFSQPHVQVITLQSDEIISFGSFRLKLDNYLGVVDDLSDFIECDSTAKAFKAALEKMSTIGEVEVERFESFDKNSNPHVYRIRWRVSFISSVADNQPPFIPIWHGSGCNDCSELKVSDLSKAPPNIIVQITQSHKEYTQEAELQPRDITSTDFLGSSLALDGMQAVIGSMHSAAKTRTTWDFETGDLSGWEQTGDAFRYQPTYGDNSKHRAVYEGYGNEASKSSGESQSSRLVGRYYVGTFEKRPSSLESYQSPDITFPLGNFQGDEPTGTLTSDPFIILGNKISFLIGGGCNALTVYVELLVDGFPSLRETGKCSERMYKVSWDVEIFKNRAGQIRIVDHGSKKWDHINVDEIQFSWNMRGTCHDNNFGRCTEGGGKMPKESDSRKDHYTGREESPKAGSAYFFRRKCSPLPIDDASQINSLCEWVEQNRVVASDKRGGNTFGFSADVDDVNGIALIGSPNSPAYGLHQDLRFIYPHSNLTTINLPVPEDLENMMKSGSTFSATGGNIRLVDYLIHRDRIPIKEATQFSEKAGATYVYLRQPALYGPSGEVIQQSLWKEQAKIAPPGVAAGDNFGFNIALDGKTAVIGAVGHDKHSPNGGAAFVYDLEWTSAKFSEVEFVAVEGADRSVKIYVERDLSLSNSHLILGYSTSDLSAIGVDSAKFDYCISLHASERDGCGDYEQASGKVTFGPGQERTYFTIRVMDDLCTERYMEYVQLNLHQIGGSLLQGEGFRAQLRIDDDDFQRRDLSMRCKGGIG